ncbi:REM2- and Rab-like small GTPase 1 isoform X2 [Cephus cinctus]|nr:REM2- and Rab-like small GTPase 1 isoform X2 [Cephus cinctus]XP_015605245.1 REM2- and Rab-like small GTPase 1 isoform X2 [Cephus cinctus]XP_015605252.1 REM2- and Rab-like small GTPase 1 isoform X2 [Cephus cinctus]XP_024946274.1 REM2- and Rab-like small GTPase 1 isoform X2 [Cephus cinctus]XP_024946282.1 REM2- and Rab-like small GTPase 1 isoform X2 [Cephus cinctus]
MSNAISMNWLNSTEGESLLHHFYNRSTNKRRFYGILERPPLPSSIEEVTYKIFIIGRSGVGKTSVVSRLAGNVGYSGYFETNGIKKTTIYWPVKIWDKVVLFKLHFWDTSENSIKKYNHILPVSFVILHQACKDKVDAVCTVFSFDDASSFNDVPQLMNSMSAIAEKPGNIVIGTKYRAWSSLAVTDTQVNEFEEKWKVKIIRIDTHKSVTRPEIFDCSYQLNWICETLWDRDQEFISKQVVQV